MDGWIDRQNFGYWPCNIISSNITIILTTPHWRTCRQSPVQHAQLSCRAIYSVIIVFLCLVLTLCFSHRWLIVFLALSIFDDVSCVSNYKLLLLAPSYWKCPAILQLIPINHPFIFAPASAQTISSYTTKAHCWCLFVTTAAHSQYIFIVPCRPTYVITE